MTSIFKYVINRINTHNSIRAYKHNNLQIPAGIHKIVFVNSFAYDSVNIRNSTKLEIRHSDISIVLNLYILLYCRCADGILFDCSMQKGVGGIIK